MMNVVGVPKNDDSRYCVERFDAGNAAPGETAPLLTTLLGVLIGKGGRDQAGSVVIFFFFFVGVCYAVLGMSC
jgi:hypothetical protein